MHCAVLCRAMRSRAVSLCAALCCAMLCSAVLCCVLPPSPGARSTAGREGPVVGRPVRESGSRPLLLNEILEHWADEIKPTCLLRWSRQAGCSCAELEQQVQQAYTQVCTESKILSQFANMCTSRGQQAAGVQQVHVADSHV
jgi:hypothetical protein